MGLGLSHGCGHFSYSGFNNWRRVICRVAGLGELNDYTGFGGVKTWPSKTTEPLVTLLYHSDCDGELAVEDLTPLADRLQSIIDKVDAMGGFVEGSEEAEHVHDTKTFIAGLRRAAEACEPVEFR